MWNALQVKLQTIENKGLQGNKQAIPMLVTALADQEPRVRRAAALALGNIGDPEAVAPLIQRLYDQDRDVRWAAAHALGWIGDKSAVPALVETLFDLNDDISIVAMMALGWIDDASAVPGLMKLLEIDNDVIRQTAYSTVAGFEEDAIPYLLEQLGSETRARRNAAADLLADIGQAALPGLMLALQQGHTQQAAAHALQLIGAPAVPSLLQALEETENRAAVREVLTTIGQPSVMPLVDAFAESSQQGAITAVLADMQPTALPILIDLLHDSPPSHQRAALHILAEFGDMQAAPSMLAVLHTPGDNGLRVEAAIALGRLGAYNALKQALTPDNPTSIRWAAAAGLKEFERHHHTPQAGSG